MNRATLVNASIVFLVGALGCGWLRCLFWLGDGKGLVNLDMGTMILDFSVVGVLSLVGFVVSTNFALSATGGWLGGQLIFLVWEGMPHGRSPQMFAPTNLGESFLLGLLIVVVLNWSMVVGAMLGCLVRYGLNRKHRVKASSDIK